MDVVLSGCDEYFLNASYNSIFALASAPPPPANHWGRQLFSLWFIVTLGGVFFYLFFAALSFRFLYDQRLKTHPKFLKDQIKRELTIALSSIPTMSILTLPIFFGEVRGWSRLYEGMPAGITLFGTTFPPWCTLLAEALAFLAFTDCLIYWIHRGLHSRLLYGPIHKPHHLWKLPTPFASHAFHPCDGVAQSMPYHIFAYLLPCNTFLYLFLFIFVNCWTVSIHDCNFVSDFGGFLNSSAHHTDHHLHYNYNYGQYTTFWDRAFGTYREPTQKVSPDELLNAALDNAKKGGKLEAEFDPNTDSVKKGN